MINEDSVRKRFIEGYEKAPELLTLKVLDIINPIDLEAHNVAIKELKIILPDDLDREYLAEKTAEYIILLATRNVNADNADDTDTGS